MRYVVLLLALSLFSIAAQACSCVKRTEEELFREARTVVVGQVLETRYIRDAKMLGGGYVRATIDVRETLKGKVQRRMVVNDELPEGGMCSSFLRAGVEFVLFVDELQSVGMCSGTRALQATSPDKLKELQDLKIRANQ